MISMITVTLMMMIMIMIMIMMIVDRQVWHGRRRGLGGPAARAAALALPAHAPLRPPGRPYYIVRDFLLQ